MEDLAELARIELTGGEKKEILSDMESILGYVKQIEGVKIEDVKTKNELYNVWREDVAEPREFSSELITGQFPATQEGFLKVRKIL